MRKCTSFLLILLFSLVIFSQKSDLLQQHYQNEFNTFREAIAQSESMNPDTSINVLFYHLSLDIKIDAPYLTANTRCVLEPVADNLDHFELDLHPSMTVDSIIGPVTSFDHTGDALKIFLDQSFNTGEIFDIKIYYHEGPNWPEDTKACVTKPMATTSR